MKTTVSGKSGFRNRLSRVPRALWWLVGLGIVGVVAVPVDLVITWVTHRSRLAALELEVPKRTSYMELRERAGDSVRFIEWTPLDSIASVAACAVLRSEDDLFYEIGTFNHVIQKMMLRRMLRGDFSAGGSGFAQQLARNLFLGPQRTPRRKLREYVLAYQLSHALSKDRQLELYLNLVEWGPGVWGIGAASQHYFGVPASDLSPTQSVILSSLLPAPRRGEAYAASFNAFRKMTPVTRGVVRSMLFDELQGGATIERIAQWRKAVQGGANAREAMVAAEALLGPEPPARALLDADTLPLAQACDTRRRPGG